MAELDHWRPEGYESTDVLVKNLVYGTYAHSMLGLVLATRNAAPIKERVIVECPGRRDQTVITSMVELSKKHLRTLAPPSAS